ncbi:MAG TPA: DUF2007 domain-containing protein [Firmicutes bacterium]|jgi:hypothetical protein|nr:DUF2007 domain-containing protein [Bacillota bacterium]
MRMPEQEEDWVELLEVNSPARADLIKSVLAGSGIVARIPQESFSLTYGGVLGIKLMVRRADLERAKELLAERE